MWAAFVCGLGSEGTLAGVARRESNSIHRAAHAPPITAPSLGQWLAENSNIVAYMGAVLFAAPSRRCNGSEKLRHLGGSERPRDGQQGSLAWRQFVAFVASKQAGSVPYIQYEATSIAPPQGDFCMLWAPTRTQAG